MPDLQHTIADFCFELEKAQSYTRVRELLLLAAEAFGASFYLLGIRTGKTISPPAQIVLSNYPKPWQRYYDEQAAYAFDPVINKAFQLAGPFRWDGLHTDERQLALRRESVRNGMEFGFSCPDRGPDGSIAILSFCGEQRIAPEPVQWDVTECPCACWHRPRTGRSSASSSRGPARPVCSAAHLAMRSGEAWR
jgi:Autoinducer binding domain.